MDTPDRYQIGSSKTTFEESPFSNFINSLSPINYAKSAQTTHAFNSLSMSSVPSVFTSPHVTSHKDSTFLRRHHFYDPSKPNVNSDDGEKIDNSEEIVDAANLCDNAVLVEPICEPLKLTCDLSHNLKDNSRTEGESSLKFTNVPATLVPCDREVLEKTSSEGETNLQKLCPVEHNKERTEYVWQSLMSDESELLDFDSPTETQNFGGIIHQSHEQIEFISRSNVSQFKEDNNDAIHKEQTEVPYEQYITEHPSTQLEEPRELDDINQTLGAHSMTNLPASNASEKRDTQTFLNLHRGIRRRCLDFEITGARRKRLNISSSCSSSMVSQFDEGVSHIDKQLDPIKPAGDSSSYILPRFGLYLNALPLTPMNPVDVKHEILENERNLYRQDSTAFHSPTTGEDSLANLLMLSPVERDAKPLVIDVQLNPDASLASTTMASDDFNQSSPKQKRRRLEVNGENGTCKRCNCKKSKCLKLYCECFAAGVYCLEPCACQDCYNKPVHEDTVLATRKQIESRNPLAFAPKVIKTPTIIKSADLVPDNGEESNQTPASARHKRGCNCKKSSCLKKYCECYQGGVGCSVNCRCEGCKNAFGTKDGVTVMETEVLPDDEEKTKVRKVLLHRRLHKQHKQNNEEQNTESSLLATPLNISRLLTELPSSSTSKLLQRSFIVGSSSGLQISHKLSRPICLPPQPKYEKVFPTTAGENDIPEILRCNNSAPNSSVKSASPNSKRVSPPQTNFGRSPAPGLRSSRKLILHSIPSFPSLNPQP